MIEILKIIFAFIIIVIGAFIGWEIFNKIEDEFNLTALGLIIGLAIGCLIGFLALYYIAGLQIVMY